MLSVNVCLHLPGGHEIPGQLPIETLQTIWSTYFIHTYDTADRMLSDYMIIYHNMYQKKLREPIGINDLCRLLIIAKTKFEFNIDTYKTCNIISITEHPPLIEELTNSGKNIIHIDPCLVFTSKTIEKMDPNLFGMEQCMTEVHINYFDLIKRRENKIPWLHAVTPAVREILEDMAVRASRTLEKRIKSNKLDIEDRENMMYQNDQFNMLIAAYMHLSTLDHELFLNDSLVKELAESYKHTYVMLERVGQPGLDKYRLPFMMISYEGGSDDE